MTDQRGWAVHSLLNLFPAVTRSGRRPLLGLAVLMSAFVPNADADESGVQVATSAASAGSAIASAGRLKATFEGIECEYSLGQEPLAQLLAHRFVLHNREVTAEIAAGKARPMPLLPLSARDLRANRAVYLGRIATLLGLERVTALQDECYDAFLANYQETMLRYAAAGSTLRSLEIVKKMTLWDGTELVRRLESGEKVAGMSYDPVTKSKQTLYGGHLELELGEQLRALADSRQKLKFATRLSIGTQDGVTAYGGRIDVNPPALPAVAPAADPADGSSQWFPVIIPAGFPAEAPEQLAERLWTGLGEHSVTAIFTNMAQSRDAFPVMDPQIAFLVLHETVEIGIVDRYFRGKDRRWFCDGMANYCAWRVIRDVQGEDVATQVHNLPAMLKTYADLAGLADLRQWPAAENETPEDSRSRLELARYAFAERAVALMDARGGDDIIPHLFAEIGNTAPEKVSIKTVAKAWKKLTGTKLDDILAEAMKPVATTPGESPAGK